MDNMAQHFTVYTHAARGPFLALSTEGMHATAAEPSTWTTGASVSYPQAAEGRRYFMSQLVHAGSM